MHRSLRGDIAHSITEKLRTSTLSWKAWQGPQKFLILFHAYIIYKLQSDADAVTLGTVLGGLLLDYRGWDGGDTLERCERGIWSEIEIVGCSGDFLVQLTKLCLVLI